MAINTLPQRPGVQSSATLLPMQNRNRYPSNVIRGRPLAEQRFRRPQHRLPMPQLNNNSFLDDAVNTAAQSGRVFGGVAQGTVKTLGALPILAESAVNAITGNDTTPIADAVAGANTGVQQWTDSWVPEPNNPAAEFSAKAFDAIGEAAPATVAAIATGGASVGTSALTKVAVGSVASYATAGAKGFSTEVIEGSGDIGRALVVGGIEGATEAIGGKATGAILNKVGSSLGSGLGSKLFTGFIDSNMEGVEEVLAGGSQAALFGENYSLGQAVEDFALGATVGAVIQGGASGVNTINTSVKTSQVQNAAQSRITDAANADISDVAELIARSNVSPASAVVAQDSLQALQKSVTNPVNVTQTKNNIPSDIAQKYGLVQSNEGIKGKEVSIKTTSYESIVNPQVADMTVTEVPIPERASIDPNAVEYTNERALYQFAPDIYLQPGTNLEGNVFTYRGQANQFYRTSLEYGSIPASGVNTSWEGSGDYSSFMPFTTDLYGPTGKLSDNPYSNRGIRQQAIDGDTPVGLIMQQSANLQQDIAPLTRTDAPNDVVPEGVRRIRYDDKDRGLITEVINNPSDVKGVGLNFTRTTVENAIPIQYASQPNATNFTDSQTQNISNTNQTASNDTQVQSRNNNNAVDNTTETTAAEEITYGRYVIPEAINTEVLGYGINASAANEIEGAEVTTERNNSPPMAPVSATTNSVTNETGNTSQSTESSMRSESTASTSEIRTSTTETPINTNVITNNRIITVQSEPIIATSYQQDTNPSDIDVAIDVQETNSAQETPNETLQAERRAAEIWTPVQNMQQMAEEQRRKDREFKGADFSINRGSGATGQVYETQGYNTSFGGLSSYN